MFHVVWNEEHKKWVVKNDDNDVWIRSSYYKILAIRKAIKFIRSKIQKPVTLIIHLKDGRIAETRQYVLGNGGKNE